jgi:hypothetical protein
MLYLQQCPFSISSNGLVLLTGMVISDPLNMNFELDEHCTFRHLGQSTGLAILLMWNNALLGAKVQCQFQFSQYWTAIPSNFVSILWYSPLLEMLRAAPPCSCFIFYIVNCGLHGTFLMKFIAFIRNGFGQQMGFGLLFFLLLLLRELNDWPKWLHLNSLSPYDDICRVLPISVFFFWRNFVKMRKIKLLKECSVIYSLKFFFKSPKKKSFWAGFARFRGPPPVGRQIKGGKPKKFYCLACPVAIWCHVLLGMLARCYMIKLKKKSLLPMIITLILVAIQWAHEPLHEHKRAFIHSETMSTLW